MNTFRKLSVFVISLFLLCTLTIMAGADGPVNETTVLFTHDLHSHFFPQRTQEGAESGGYARLMTALER